uniref:Uncharacterized protein n=1 Tax=Ditylenchus dipsaci TaxID=166011 RepID=A0A915D5X4_9BILA
MPFKAAALPLLLRLLMSVGCNRPETVPELPARPAVAAVVLAVASGGAAVVAEKRLPAYLLGYQPLGAVTEGFVDVAAVVSVAPEQAKQNCELNCLDFVAAAESQKSTENGKI